ncbi:hypothetical protein D9M70_600590 [compost metagenome]
MAGARRQRTGLPPTGHTAVDQLRIACQADIRPEAQALHDAGTEAFDKNVGAFDQLQKHLGCARFARVDHQATAATADYAVIAVEEARLLPVDANYFRPHIRQQHGGEGRRPDRIHFDYLHPSQWSRHVSSL